MVFEKSPRIGCQIRCEIVRGKHRTPATVVNISDGGIGVKTDLEIEEGDDARIRLLPSRGRPEVEVGGIVWNERLRHDAHGVVTNRVLVFVISDPPPGFTVLYEDMLRREQGSTQPVPHIPEPRITGQKPTQEPPSARAKARVRRRSAEARLRSVVRPTADPPLEIVREKPADQTLPRPKSPLPPPKQDETLPLFRVRVKQVDGPRSKWLEIRAQSLQDVEIWIRRYLEGEWEVLQIGSIQKPRP